MQCSTPESAMAALDVATDVEAVREARSRRSAGMLFWAATAWIALVIVTAVLADLLPLPSPTDMDMLGRRMPPDLEHWLGTDGLGRDTLARLIFGARTSLIVGLGASLLGLLFGGALGIVAGYYRGKFETLTMGGVDVLLAFPPLVLALAITAYLGQSVFNLTAIVRFPSIPQFPRVVRAATLAFAHRDFIPAARAMGATDARILL